MKQKKSIQNSFLIFLFIITKNVLCQGDIKYDEAAERFFTETNPLEYDEKCSFEDELKRVELRKQIMRFAVRSGDTETDKFQDYKGLTRSLNEFTSDTSRRFCSSDSKLQCSSTTGKCDCAFSLFIGTKVNSSREGGICQLRHGSPCSPEELEPNTFKCEEPGTCRVKSTWKECTTDNFLVEVENIGRKYGLQGVKAVFDKVDETFDEGFCFCTGHINCSLTYVFTVLIAVFVNYY